jgi:hypothetical protein
LPLSKYSWALVIASSSRWMRSRTDFFLVSIGMCLHGKMPNLLCNVSLWRISTLSANTPPGLLPDRINS